MSTEYVSNTNESTMDTLTDVATKKGGERVTVSTSTSAFESVQSSSDTGDFRSRQEESVGQMHAIVEGSEGATPSAGSEEYVVPLTGEDVAAVEESTETGDVTGDTEVTSEADDSITSELSLFDKLDSVLSGVANISGDRNRSEYVVPTSGANVMVESGDSGDVITNGTNVVPRQHADGAFTQAEEPIRVGVDAAAPASVDQTGGAIEVSAAGDGTISIETTALGKGASVRLEAGASADASGTTAELGEHQAPHFLRPVQGGRPVSLATHVPRGGDDSSGQLIISKFESFETLLKLYSNSRMPLRGSLLPQLSSYSVLRTARPVHRAYLQGWRHLRTVCPALSPRY